MPLISTTKVEETVDFIPSPIQVVYTLLNIQSPNWHDSKKDTTHMYINKILKRSLAEWGGGGLTDIENQANL